MVVGFGLITALLGIVLGGVVGFVVAFLGNGQAKPGEPTAGAGPYRFGRPALAVIVLAFIGGVLVLAGLWHIASILLVVILIALTVRRRARLSRVAWAGALLSLAWFIASAVIFTFPDTAEGTAMLIAAPVALAGLIIWLRGLLRPA